MSLIIKRSNGYFLSKKAFSIKEAEKIGEKRVARLISEGKRVIWWNYHYREDITDKTRELLNSKKTCTI